MCVWMPSGGGCSPFVLVVYLLRVIVTFIAVFDWFQWCGLQSWIGFNGVDHQDIYDHLLSLLIIQVV